MILSVKLRMVFPFSCATMLIGKIDIAKPYCSRTPGQVVLERTNFKCEVWSEFG